MRVQLRRAGGHGDMLSLTSAIPGLKKRYPGAEVDFMTSEDYDQLILHDPRIAKILPWYVPFDYDQADLIVRAAHAGVWGAARKKGESLWMFEAQCHVLGVEPSLPKLYLLPEELEAAGGCDVALANRYPVLSGRSYRHMTRLAVLLIRSGYHVRQIDGGPCMCQAIDDSPLTIREAAAEVAKARCLVTIDSVFLHIGAALGRPMVVIFNQAQRSGPESQYVPNSWIADWHWSSRRIVPMVKHLLGDGPAPDEENTFDPAYRRGYE